MLFLLAKILLLLVVAALLGAWFVRWWFMRYYEDVTTEYARLDGDWQGWRRAFESKLAERPAADLSPILEPLRKLTDAVNGIQIPPPVATDLGPVLNAIAAIPAAPAPAPQAPPVDLGPTQRQIAAVEAAVRAIPTPLAPPPVDLASVNSHLASLGASIAAIRIPVPAAPPPPVDLAPVATRLEALDARIAALRFPTPQNVDLSSVLARLAALEQAVRDIVIPPAAAVDLQPVLQKLAELESRSQPAPAAPTAPSVPTASSAPAAAAAQTVPTEPASGATVRAGSKNLLSHAGYGRADDLKRIKGVKTVMEKMLHEIGVYYFWQIAEWTPTDIQHADAQLSAFHGRIERDDWVVQATAFAAAPGVAAKPAAL